MGWWSGQSKRKKESCMEVKGIKRAIGKRKRRIESGIGEVENGERSGKGKV